MFARFRNLFSKTKNETEVETGASFESSYNCPKNSINPSGSKEVEGINYLKLIVEQEQKCQQNTTQEDASTDSKCLSEEVADLLEKRLTKSQELESANEEKLGIKTENPEKIKNTLYEKEISDKEKFKQQTHYKEYSMDGDNKVSDNISMKSKQDLLSGKISFDNDGSQTSLETTSGQADKAEKAKKLESPEDFVEKKEDEGYIHNENPIKPEINPIVSSKPPDFCTDSHINIVEATNSANNNPASRENSPELSETSKSLTPSLAKENLCHSTTPYSNQTIESTNLCNNNSSIVVEDLPSELSTPCPSVESSNLTGSSSSNTSTLDSISSSEVLDPTKIIVNPIDNNDLACRAITNKLSDIAEVAESLDTIIRDVQENVQSVEAELNPSPSHKKQNTLQSASSEDWHSRSTEDDSFVTASEGNFTPSSSSFQTALDRTSSNISCDKNSFDASEADDSTYAFEMTELASPLSTSFEGSEQSYLSAQHLNSDFVFQDKQKASTKLSESESNTVNLQEEEENSIADVQEMNSESVTPTPPEKYDDYRVRSIAIEEETELEVAGIAEAPSMEIITEHTALPMSRTPEVRPSTSNACSNQNPITTQTTVNVARDSNDQLEQQNSTNNNNKPNVAWRRSKYYENITKQTIKGFL